LQANSRRFIFGTSFYSAQDDMFKYCNDNNDEVIDLIFWIEKQFKKEYINSAKNSGVRCKFSIDFNESARKEIENFIKFIRINYYFPIRLNISFFEKTHFVSDVDGHKYYGIFYDGDSAKKAYPKIHIAGKLTKGNPMYEILLSIAHEITHYYQWYFLEDIKRTDRSLEIEANKWAKYILHSYSCQHPTNQ
jgi:hypothetical protein